MADSIGSRRGKGIRVVRIGTVIEPLPFGPETIHIGMQHEEKRIASGRSDTGDEPSKRRMSGTVRITFHIVESPENGIGRHATEG
jgi:hypothetical protein